MGPVGRLPANGTRCRGRQKPQKETAFATTFETTSAMVLETEFATTSATPFETAFATTSATVFATVFETTFETHRADRG